MAAQQIAALAAMIFLVSLGMPSTSGAAPCPLSEAQEVAEESGLIAAAESRWSYRFEVSFSACGQLTRDQRTDMIVVLRVIGGTGNSPTPWAIFNGRQGSGFTRVYMHLGSRSVSYGTLVREVRIAKRRAVVRSNYDYQGATTVYNRVVVFRWTGNRYQGRERRMIRAEGGALHRPRSFCAEDHTCFSRAKWLRWSGRDARARATLRVCLPAAACRSARVTLMYDRVRRVCNVLSYARFRYRYMGRTYRGRLTQLGSFCNWTANYP